MTAAQITIWSWRQVILRSPLAATTKLVLLALSTYMNDHGEGCYPSQSQIAADTSLSERAVINHLAMAVQAGFLVKDKRQLKGKKWDANEYRASFPAINEPDSPQNEGVNLVHPTPEEGVGDVDNYPPRGEPDAGKGCTTFTCGVNDVHTNSSKNSSGNSEEKRAGEECEKVPPSLPDEIIRNFEEVIVLVFGKGRSGERSDDREAAEQMIACGATPEQCREVFLRTMTRMQLKNKPAPAGLVYFRDIIRETVRQSKPAPRSAARTITPLSEDERKFWAWIRLQPFQLSEFYAEKKRCGGDEALAREKLREHWEKISI